MNTAENTIKSLNHPWRWFIAAVALLMLLIATWQLMPGSQESSLELLQRGLHAIGRQDRDALYAVQHTLQKSGRRAERAILDAQQALINRDFTQALNLSVLAEQGLPEARDFTYAIRVEALYNFGQLGEAEGLALHWLSLDPDQPVAHRWLGAIYYDLGAMEQARRHLTALIDLQPTDPMPRYLLGLIFHDYEHFGEAVDALQGLLKLAVVPADIADDAVIRLADSLIQMSRFQEALELLKPMQDSAGAIARYAECLLTLGNSELARTQISEAFRKCPADLIVLTVLADIQMHDQEYAAAEDSLRSLLRLDAYNVRANHQLAQALRLQGRTEEANQQLKTFESCQKTMLELADLHRKAIQHPWDADRRDHIAELLTSIGRHEKADMWRRAAESCRQASSPLQPSASIHVRGSPDMSTASGSDREF